MGTDPNQAAARTQPQPSGRRISSHDGGDALSLTTSPPQPPRRQRTSQQQCDVLEGTLVYRNKSAKKSSGLKKNTRTYAVFDTSGAAGACLDVGGMGSLKFYRFLGLSKSEEAAAYPSTRLGEGGSVAVAEHLSKKHWLCLDIPGHLPWMAVDVENDPTGFRIEIATSGLGSYSPAEVGGGQNLAHSNDAETGKAKASREADTEATADAEAAIEQKESGESDEDMDNDGVFAYWGGDGESEDEADDQTEALDEDGSRTEDQVHRDLARAASRNKIFVKYDFKVQSENNEKALWIAAFERAGRLSEKAKKRKNIFGSNPSTSQKLKRTRSSNDSGGDIVPEREYRVRPHYAYLHRWMTHDELTEEMDAPSSVIHDTRLSPTVATGREVGLLRVEVLQCLGLPRPRGKDPNAVVYLVFGSYAFATDVITQCQNPMWLCAMKRACAMPIHHGYAALMAGVFHDDGSSKNKDTFIGRIEIKPIAQLRPNTTYDITIPLRQSTSVYNRKQLGALRLRIFLEYKDEKQVILSYLPSRRNKTGGRVNTTVACADQKSFHNVALVVHGQHLPEKFSADVFMAAIRELNFTQAVIMRHSKQSLRDLISWRIPIRSAYAFCGWMFLVHVNSIALVPVYSIGFLLLHLVSSYALSCQQGNFRPPSWGELLLALKDSTTKKSHIGAGGQEDNLPPSLFHLVGIAGATNGDGGLAEFPFARLAGYHKYSVSEVLVSSGLESFDEDEIDDYDADDRLERSSSGTKPSDFKPTGFSQPLPEQNIDIKKKSDKTIAQELQEVEGRVQKATKSAFEYHTYYATDDSEPPFGKKVSGDKGSEDFRRDLDKILGIGQFSSWNPIVGRVTSQFIPIIRILSVVLSFQRSLYNIFAWTDPILSFLLSIVLIVGLVILVIFPWRITFWAVGLFLLGPQNWAFRVIRECVLLNDEMRPGRFLRALRELLKDDEGKVIWSSQNEGKDMLKSIGQHQPVFHCHAPASNPLMEKTAAGGAQHIVVPYSPLYFNRFYDWPPDPDCSRILSSATSNGTLRSSSLNDEVAVHRLLHPLESTHPVKPDEVAKKSPCTDDIMSQNPENETASKAEGSISLAELPQDMRISVDPKDSKNDGDAPKKPKFSLKSRFAARVNKKLQPALSKYKHAGIHTALAAANADDATDADFTTCTLGEGIPSIIETVTKEQDSVDISEVYELKQNEECGASSPSDNGKATVDKEKMGNEVSEKMEKTKAHENEKVQSDSGLLHANEMNKNSRADTGITDPSDLSSPVANLNPKAVIIDSASAASPGAHSSTEVNNACEKPGQPMASDSAGVPSPDAHSTEEESYDKYQYALGNNAKDDCDRDALRQPSPSSDSSNLLHQLMEIKLELATTRTENDTFRKRLKETEAERDIYQEKYEQSKKHSFTLVSPFGKNKNTSKSSISDAV